MEDNKTSFLDKCKEIKNKVHKWREKRWEKQDKKHDKKMGKIRKRPLLLNIFLYLPKTIFKIVKFIICTCTVLLITATIIGSIIFIKVYPTVKEAREVAYEKFVNCNEETFQLLSNTLIYDKDNNLIGEINAGNFEYVNIENVSNYVTEGYIAVEDKNFKSHPGIDIEGIARAAVALVKNNGEITQGGSTITQQVVKNNLLTKEQTFFRKITEVFISLDMEREFTKADIMEFYLNTNFYGNNCYGIEAASHYYFGIPSKSLTPAQAATLIGVSNAPSAYDPVREYDACMRKKEIVLSLMYKNGVLTEEEYNLASNEEIKILQKNFDNASSISYQATYALHCAVLQLMQMEGFEFKYLFESKEEEKEYKTEYNELYASVSKKIREGGYIIHTSLDSNIQNELQMSIDNNLSDYNEMGENGIYAMQSAAVCIDNDTNYVVAIVGGRSGSGEFNRAYQTARQPGSSIKPLLDYGPVFDTGEYYPSLIMEDKKIDGDYSPSNSGGGYSGNVTIRTAIKKSINTIAYQCFYNLGIDNCIEYLNNLHFSTLTYEDQFNPAISLGGFTNGVSVVDMAKGYNTIANNGEYSNRTCIISISNVDGELYNSNKELTTPIYSKDTAFLLTNCLQDAVQSGTGTRAKVENQIIAGKTGTTNSNKDAWFCGFSKHYTTTVWVGYDTPKSMKGMTGGKLPAIIFSDFMTKISVDKPTIPFEAPETIVEKYIDEFGNPSDTEIIIFNEETQSSKTCGTEYFSSINTKGISETKKEEIKREKYNIAVDLLERFEVYTLENASANKEYLYELYNNAKAAILSLEDEYQQAELYARLNIKYEYLHTIIDSYAASYEEEIQKQKDAEILARLESDRILAEEAAQKLYNERIATANYYLTELEKQTVYDEYTKQLIECLRTAVNNLIDYPEYDSYYSKQEIAIFNAECLPLPEIVIVPETSDETNTEEQ